MVLQGALWMTWIHRGQMKALSELSVVNVDVVKFCDITKTVPDVYVDTINYAEDFIKECQAAQFFKMGPFDFPLDWIVGREKASSGDHDNGVDELAVASEGAGEQDKDAVEFTDSECDDPVSPQSGKTSFSRKTSGEQTVVSCRP